jgi:hypothetical protein
VNRDLEVDVPEVRGCASGLTDTGARVAAGVGGRPATVAGWAASAAAESAADATQRRLLAVGSDIAATARQIIAAVVDYEAADDRAVTRLRGVR